MSPGKFPDPAFVRSIRRNFVSIWSDYLRDNFVSTAHVAVTFGVDESTARGWWGAVTGPSGFAVAIAMTIHPEDILRRLPPARRWGGRLRAGCSRRWGRASAA